MFITTIAAPGFHQHLHAQQVTSEEPRLVQPANSASSAASPANYSSSQSQDQQDLPDLSSIPDAVPLVEPIPAEDQAVLESDTQSRHGDVYVLAGNVEITYRSHDIRADTITYNAATGEVIADGHVHLTGGANDESIEASHAFYNLRTQTGRFYDVRGSVEARLATPSLAPDQTMASEVALPPPNPFLFAGRLVVKKGPTSYDVYNGWVTACLLPHPDWQLFARHISMSDGKARAAESTFRLINVPILFLPYVTHPVDTNQRQSGIMIPVLSESSTEGLVVGEQVYLVLGRSADATVGVNYMSMRGYSEMGTVRYRGQGNNFFTAHFSALQDRGYDQIAGDALTYVNQGGEDITASFRRDFTNNLRGAADGEYLSSYIYREAFDDNYNTAVSSDITSVGFLDHQSNGYDFSGRFQRYEGLKRVPYTNSLGEEIAGEEVKIFHAPSLDADILDHRIPGTPLLWSLTASGAGLKRVQPDFSTPGLVARYDFRPEIALPLSGDGWHMLASVALRNTFYSRSRVAPYGPAAVPIELQQSVNRSSIETKIDVRPPAIERTFEVPARYQKWFGSEVRHTVEPEITYQETSGISNFLSVLRFDETDLDSDTNELEYGVTQHLYFRPLPRKPAPLPPGCPTPKAASTKADETPGASQQGAGDEDSLPSMASSIDANGIPSIDQTAAEAPTRSRRRNPCARTHMVPPQREWFSWQLAQRYIFNPTFGGAVIDGRRNVFTSTLDLSGIAFLTEPRNITPLVSRMRFRTSTHTDVEWDFDLDTGAKKFTRNNLFFDTHEGNWFGGFSFARLNAPGRFYTELIDTTTNTSTLVDSATSNFMQSRILLGYGSPEKPGLSLAGSGGFDLREQSLQYGSLQASYNWNCCGLTAEYRKYELGSVRNESEERFSFTLINIGSAGNLRRQERLF